MFELITSIPVHNILGEGVTWNEQTQTVWWTDIEGCRLFRCREDGSDLKQWQTPERLGAFGFLEDNSLENDTKLVAAFASGVALYQPDNGIVEWITRLETDKAHMRMNDGRVDNQGRFWIGSMSERFDQSDTDYGTLFRIDNDGKATAIVDHILISNALCWSPDSKKMYHADSTSFTINVYDFDAATGNASNPKIFAQTPEGVIPDGAVTDAAGRIWNAQFGGGKVVCYSPAGDIEAELHLPVTCPTCVAFGGSDLSMLFITSATVSLSETELQAQPNAGNLFIYRTPYRGLLQTRAKPFSIT